MDRKLINFGKRMDAAQDKKTLIIRCEGAKRVLDLGAGTGAMAREIAKKYGCQVDAVDLQWKAENMDTCDGKVNYIQDSIAHFIHSFDRDQYDCIILSGIIHELDWNTVATIHEELYKLMANNCRIIIREPFWEPSLKLVRNFSSFTELVSEHISSYKALQYAEKSKLSLREIKAYSWQFWLNLAFVVSYGEDSWDRECHEYRYAYDLKFCKSIFDLVCRPYTGFQIYPVLDTTYRQHFINAGIPGEAFDLIGYTGMHVVIDYSR